MKTDAMRWIDRYAGSPLCHLVAACRGLFVRPAATGPVVVCKFFGMGSISLTYPLLKALNAAGRDIVYLSFRSNDPVLVHVGAGRRILIDPATPWTFLCSTVRAVRDLRRLHPSGFLNLEFFSRFAGLMAMFSGAPVRAGFHVVHLPVGKLYTDHASLNVYRHIAENFLNVGVAAGMLGPQPAAWAAGLEFPRPGPAKIEGVRAGYILLNGESSDTIGVLKAWPAAHWQALARELRRAYPGRAIVFMGTEGARHVYGTLPGDDGDAVDMIGRTTVDEMLALIAGAALVITVDSAPLHFGALMDRPTVGLFGPESPVLYGHERETTRMIYKGLPCSPCLALYDAKKSVLDCQDNQCLRQISVDEVMAAAGQLLAPEVASRRASKR